MDKHALVEDSMHAGKEALESIRAPWVAQEGGQGSRRESYGHASS